MSARRLSNGNILARVAYSGQPGEPVGDGLVELAPGDPAFEQWDRWLARWEAADLEVPNEEIPTEDDWAAASEADGEGT